MTLIEQDNFVEYALRNYYKKNHIDYNEFTSTLNRIVYINRLLNKDHNANHRLILNHIIITANSFNVNATTNMLYSRIDSSRWKKLSSYLIYLNYISPEDTPEYDKQLVSILQNL